MVIPETLKKELDAIRERSHSRDPILRQEAAVCLYSGIGGTGYLTMDGRILIRDASPASTIREASEDREIAAALYEGADSLSLPALLLLLPERGEGSTDCPRCQKRGHLSIPGEWKQVGGSRDGEVGPLDLICPLCGGLGWRGR